MTDFGRKDFGGFLKQLFEADDAATSADDFQHVDDFKSSRLDAAGKAAAKLDKSGLQEIGDKAQTAMKEFVKLWTPFTQTLKDETAKTIKSLELFAAANQSKIDDTETSDDAAATAAFGGTKADM